MTVTPDPQQAEVQMAEAAKADGELREAVRVLGSARARIDRILFDSSHWKSVAAANERELEAARHQVSTLLSKLEQAEATQLELAAQLNRARESRGPYPGEVVSAIADAYKLHPDVLTTEDVTAWLLRVIPRRHAHLKAAKAAMRVAGSAKAFVEKGDGGKYRALVASTEAYEKARKEVGF